MGKLINCRMTNGMFGNMLNEDFTLFTDNADEALFILKQGSPGVMALVMAKPGKNGGKMQPWLSKEQADALSSKLPKGTVNPHTRNIIYKFKIEDLADQNSEAVQTLKKIAKGVSSLGDFGTIDPEGLVDEIQKYAKVSVTKEVSKSIQDDEMGAWSNVIQNFDDKMLDKIRSMHMPIPLSSLSDISYNLSARNLELIEIQNDKRVAKGFERATYILSPQEWRDEFNRKVNFDHCYPIYYYVPITGRDVVKSEHEKGIQRDSSHAMAYKDLNDFASKFRLYPYFDITDTVIIPGYEDKDLWYSPKRMGVINNLFIIPTEYTASQLDSDSSEYNKERNDIIKNMDREDDVYALAVYKTLHILLGIGGVELPTKEDGSVNMEIVKSRILPLMLNYMETLDETRVYAKNDNETRLKLMNFAAHMFILRHRLSNNTIVDSFKRICDDLKTNNKDFDNDAFKKELLNMGYASYTIYLAALKNLKSYFEGHDSGNNISTGARAKAESLAYRKNRSLLPLSAQAAIPDRTGKVLNPNAIYKHNSMNHDNQQNVNENQNFNGGNGNDLSSAEKLIDSLFDAMGVGGNDIKLFDGGASDNTGIVNESSDDWFCFDDKCEAEDDFSSGADNIGTDYIYYCCTSENADRIMVNGFTFNRNDMNIHGPGIYFYTTLEQAESMIGKYGDVVIVTEVLIDDMIDYKHSQNEGDIAIARSSNAVKPVKVLHRDEDKRGSLYESQIKSTFNSFYNILNRIDK